MLMQAGFLCLESGLAREDIDCVLGDTAYGGMEVRESVRTSLGVRLLAPPPPSSRSSDLFVKTDFDMDFEHDAVTCPGGVTTTTYTSPPSLAGGRRFRGTRKQCAGCPLAEQCLGPGRRSRSVNLHAFEEQQRTAREEWARPEVKAAYRVRTQCERLINRMTRHGGRQARAWGLASAHLQAHAIALTNNLALMAKALANAAEPVALLPDRIRCLSKMPTCRHAVRGRRVPERC